MIYELYYDKYYVKSQITKKVLIEGFLDVDGLYFFSKLIIDTSRSALISNSHDISSFVLKSFISNSRAARSSNKRVHSSKYSSSSLWHSRLIYVNPFFRQKCT